MALLTGYMKVSWIDLVSKDTNDHFYTFYEKIVHYKIIFTALFLFFISPQDIIQAFISLYMLMVCLYFTFTSVIPLGCVCFCVLLRLQGVYFWWTNESEWSPYITIKIDAEFFDSLENKQLFLHAWNSFDLSHPHRGIL